jgi:hypothetical protein
VKKISSMNLHLKNLNLSLGSISQAMALILASLARPFQAWWVSLGYLSSVDREFFYTLLAESVRSNVGLDAVFSDLDSSDNSNQLRRLARFAKRGMLSQADDFTAFFEHSGLLPADDVYLLRVGAERGGLPAICDFLVAQHESTITFDSYFLKEAGQWLVSVPAGLLIAVYLGDSLSGLRFSQTGEQKLFFYIYDFIDRWLWYLFLIPSLLVLFHRLALGSVATYSAVAGKLFLFHFYQKQWELKVCRICAVLVPTGIQNWDLLGHLQGVTQGNRALSNRISRARRKAGEHDLKFLLSSFLSPSTVSKIKAKSPHGDPDSMGEGFSMAARINYLSMSNEIKRATGFWVLVLFFLSAVILGPLVALMSGL